MDEMISFCQNVGFRIIETKYTNASNWLNEYEATSTRAKELLIICQK